VTYDLDLGKLGDGYILNSDLLYTKSQDSAIIYWANLERTGTAPDGRPIYTNTRGFLNDAILTNVKGKDGESINWSIALNKAYDSGWDWSLGYAYTHSKDVNPMTSSVSFSNYANIAVSDPNNPGPAVSNYLIPHRFTARLAYEAYWWDDNRTKITLFGAVNQGRPYSYVFSRTDGDVFGDRVDYRHLLYVPDGPNDPLVVYADSFDQQAFWDFVDKEGLKPGIQKRNDQFSNWWGHLDLKFEQDFPGFFQKDKFTAYVVISNFCNLLNDNWCVLKEASFPRTDDVVIMDIQDGKYVFEDFVRPGGQSRATNPSLWEMRIGLRYVF